MRNGLRAAGAVLAGIALALAVSACSTSGSSAPTVAGAWIRPPQGADLPAAGYLVITGGSQADALLSVSSPAAGTVMLHQTTTDSAGMTGMQMVDRLPIPAGAAVKLEPGGYHLMLEDITGTLTVGGKVQLDLTFEKAGRITVQAEVKQG